MFQFAYRAVTIRNGKYDVKFAYIFTTKHFRYCSELTFCPRFFLLGNLTNVFGDLQKVLSNPGLSQNIVNDMVNLSSYKVVENNHSLLKDFKRFVDVSYIFRFFYLWNIFHKFLNSMMTS